MNQKLFLKKQCYIIIILHNHPSGNPSPSKEDYIVANQIKDVGDLLNIKLIDHLIIGKDKYFSFYDYLKGGVICE